MKVSQSGSLTVQEVTEIIKLWLLQKHEIDAESITFHVSAEEDPTDWRAEYPLDHVFSGVSWSSKETTAAKKKG